MKTTLGNQLSAFAASSIAKSNNTLKTQGESLSTGMKKDISVVDSYMGNRLNDEALISKTVLNNMAFGKHITSVAAADMEIAATAIRDAINITAQAGNDNSLDALTSMFNKTIEHYDALIAKSNFNGIRLLDGTLGQDAAIRSNFKTKTVDVTLPAATAHPKFGTVSAVFTITPNFTAAGDTIGVNGVRLTGADLDADPLTFLVGADADTADSIVAKFNELKNTGSTEQQAALANYNFAAAGAVVTVTQTTPDASLHLVVSSNQDSLAVANPTPAVLSNAGTKSVDTIIVNAAGNVLAPGDSITLETVKFTAVQGEPKKEGEFSIADTAFKTRANLIAAITNHSSESLQGYRVEAEQGDDHRKILITSITAKAGNIPCIAPSANITCAPTTAGTQGGIDVSGIKDLDAFIGTIPSLKEERAVNGGGARAAAQAFGLTAAAGVDNAAFYAYSTEIGGKKFQGGLYVADNTANNNHPLNGQELVMVADKGTANEQRFVIKFAAGGAGQLNAGTLNDINAFVQGCKFTQTKSLKINTDKGDIFYQGKVIGSTKGVRAQLTASDFKNLNFEDFKVEVSGVANRVFKAVIGGKEYVSTPAAANTFVAGSRVTLTNAETGNVLAINLGNKCLTEGLSNPTQFDTIAKEFKDMFMNKGDGLEVSVGVNVADKIKINMANLSKEKIFVDDQGNYVEKLSLDRNDIGKTIQALNNALKTLRSNQSMLTAEQKNIETGAEKLRRNIDVTQEAADSYRKADLTEAAEEFASNFKMLMTAISMIQAGQKVADTVLRIVQGVAQ